MKTLIVILITLFIGCSEVIAPDNNPKDKTPIIIITMTGYYPQDVILNKVFVGRFWHGDIDTFDLYIGENELIENNMQSIFEAKKNDTIRWELTD